MYYGTNAPICCYAHTSISANVLSCNYAHTSILKLRIILNNTIVQMYDGINVHKMKMRIILAQ